MADARFTDADYVGAMRGLLPRGRVWRAEDGGVMADTLAGLAPTYTRSDAAAQGLLADVLPVSPVMMLPDWEATLGLPDPCAGPAPTLLTRQQQVAARFAGVAVPGMSVPYYTAFGRALHVQFTVQEFAPFRAGVSTAGMPACSSAWAYAWQVTPHVHLGARNRALLRCELATRKPSHTVLLFDFS